MTRTLEVSADHILAKIIFAPKATDSKENYDKIKKKLLECRWYIFWSLVIKFVTKTLKVSVDHILAKIIFAPKATDSKENYEEIKEKLLECRWYSFGAWL